MVPRHSVIGLGIFQAAVLDHGAGAGQCLLARLEHQDHKALELLFMGFQQFGCTQQHGGMGVMTAGVHFPRALGGIGQASVLGEGQSIHISPEKDAFASFFADITQHAALAAGTETDAHFLQFFLDFGSGFGQLQPQFGIFMEIPAPADDLLLHGLGFLQKAHR